MRDAQGHVLERCQECHRPVRSDNVRIGKNGMRVGPNCWRKQLVTEADSRREGVSL